MMNWLTHAIAWDLRNEEVIFNGVRRKEQRTDNAGQEQRNDLSLT